MKVLFVANIMGHLSTFHIPYMNWFHENGWEVDAAANDDSDIDMPDYVTKIHVPIQRSPYRKENLRAFSELKKVIEEKRYDIVHCHTPMGSVLARLAVKKGSKTKVLYTCHGFQFCKGGPVKDWILYYPVERFLAHRADCIITINQQDYKLAQKFACKDIRYIPGIGVDLSRFYQDDAARQNMREQLNADQTKFLVLSVGELNENKNHITVMKAIARLKNPNILYFVAGEGPLHHELERCIQDLGLERQVFLLGRRNDIPALCNAADAFAFPSQREGLGIAAIEAMSTGTPLLTSNAGGICDYSKDGITGFVCQANDIDGFAEGILKLSRNPELCEQMGQNACEAAQKFRLEQSLERMAEIYQEYMR